MNPSSKSPRQRRSASCRPNSFQRALDQRLLACSAALAAGAAVGGAQGAVIFRVANLSIPMDNNSGVFLDVDTGATQVGGSAPAGYDLNFFEQTGTQLLQLRLPANGRNGALSLTMGPYTYVRKLPASTTVGPAANGFAPYGILAAVDSQGNHGEFSSASGAVTGYIGFRFTSASDQTLYGWARITVNPGLTPDASGNVGTLLDYAFDNTGQAIMAGQVPEPDTFALGCLAAGAAGLTLWRRARQTQPPPADA